MPREIAELVELMLKQEREERLSNLEQVYDVLARHAGSAPLSGVRPRAVHKPRVGLKVGAGAVAAALGVIVAFAVTRPRSPEAPEAGFVVFPSAGAESAAASGTSSVAAAVTPPQASADAAVPAAAPSASDRPDSSFAPPARRGNHRSMPKTKEPRPGLVERAPF